MARFNSCVTHQSASFTLLKKVGSSVSIRHAYSQAGDTSK
jgi:hypothetical protein